MSADDLIARLRAIPFVPFRIVGADGRTREVYHPDQALVTLTRVALPLAAGGGVPEYVEYLPLGNIVRVENLPSSATSSTGEAD